MRPINRWDVPPVGHEHFTPMQVKEMGMAVSSSSSSSSFAFSLSLTLSSNSGIFSGSGGVSGPGSFHRPGSPSFPVQMPYVPHGSNLPLPGMPLPMPGGMDPQSHLYRQAKRLYVGNLPEIVSETDMTHFFNDLYARNRFGAGDAVVSVQLNREKNFAFLEVRRRTPDLSSLSSLFPSLSPFRLLFLAFIFRSPFVIVPRMILDCDRLPMGSF